MKSIWKNEFRRAFLNSGMLLSLLVGIGLVLWHQYTFVWKKPIEISDFYCIESLYYNWLGGNSYPMQNYVFYMILPLLATLPAGASYCEDLKNKYYIHFYTRNQKKQYLLAKYCSVFITGGLAVVIPLILSLLLTAMKFPAIRPEVIMNFEPSTKALGYGIYFSHPMIYTFLFLFIDFIFAGGFASVSLLASFYTQYKVVVCITPFALYYFLYSLDNIFTDTAWDAPNLFLNGANEFCMWYEILAGCLFFIIVGIFYYQKGKHYE